MLLVHTPQQHGRLCKADAIFVILFLALFQPLEGPFFFFSSIFQPMTSPVLFLIDISGSRKGHNFNVARKPTWKHRCETVKTSHGRYNLSRVRALALAAGPTTSAGALPHGGAQSSLSAAVKPFTADRLDWASPQDSNSETAKRVEQAA